MKFISHQNIVNLNIDPKQCYQWVEEMLINKHSAILPPKISMKPSEDIFINVMPCILPQTNVMGVKVVSRYPGRIPSLDSQIIIYDYESGRNKAIMDGNYITTMRTGAVAAHSIILLAKPNFTKIGLIGLGNQARATMKVLLSVLQERNLILKLYRYKDQHDLFIKFVNDIDSTNNVTFEICDSYDDVVKGSEVIISSVTYFASDICGDNCYDEGCLVVPIHTRGFMNCDLFFDKVYADDIDHVKKFQYFSKFRKFAEVADVLAKKAKGRENNSERILAYNIGLAIHDMFFAEKIYDLAINNGIGEIIDFCSPTEKFWI